MYFKALELGSASDKEFLRKHYGNIKNSVEVNKIRQIIKNSGALDYSDKLAREYVEKGKKFIPHLTKNKDLAETLSTFADYMITRTK